MTLQSGSAPMLSANGAQASHTHHQRKECVELRAIELQSRSVGFTIIPHQMTQRLKPMCICVVAIQDHVIHQVLKKPFFSTDSFVA